MHRRADLAHGAFHFGMAGMADQDQGAAMADIALALVVHLGDQRAGGVQHRQAAVCGGLDHRLRHAMGAEHGHRAFGHFVQFLDKAGALVLQGVHHMLVVHDLMAHIDGLAILIERLLDDIDGADDPGTKAARLGKNDSHKVPSCAPPAAHGPGRLDCSAAKPVSRIGEPEINPFAVKGEVARSLWPICRDSAELAESARRNALRLGLSRYQIVAVKPLVGLDLGGRASHTACEWGFWT